MEFGILGALEVRDAGRDVTPRRPKQRQVLATLLATSNEAVSTDRLIDVLWGDSPPPTAATALQGHVSELRKLLGAERIETTTHAYRLRATPDEVDLGRFERLVATARGATDPSARARLLAEALALWRGDPLPELADVASFAATIARLDALRLAAHEDRADAELALGRHSALIAELELLLRQHPLSERLRGQLMVALYRSGRQSDALNLYQAGRRLLAEELGIEPGGPLQAIERQILNHDPALAVPTAAAVPPRQERKQVTVLVVEFRPARSTDPEDLERVAAPVLARVRAIIERYGGTAEDLFANASLGVFGAPRAHDDDIERAVRAALEIRAAAAEPAELRMGIEHGEALVTIEHDGVSVAGDVLAGASRMQAMAVPGSIVVGERAYRSTLGVAEYADTGFGAWFAVAARAVSAAPAVEGPFIGRQEELGLLERAYARARNERSVQLATVTAEPGGGKSRLVRELRRILDASTSPPTWRQGRCLPYGDGVTYWALGEIVKGQAGILESDDSQTSAAKLAAAVAAVEPDDARRTWFERGLTALAGVEGAGLAGTHEQSFSVWRQFIEAIAAGGPLVLVFEDIHWADVALLEFIEHLVSNVSGVPLLVLCTARLELHEARPGWGGGVRNATTIGLEPLSAVDTEQLLRSLLGRAAAPATIKRASGNPLFAQELARMFEGSQSEASIAMPESLQAVIAARLDALAPDVKALAADAAVVGEVFWSGAVAAMSGLDERDVESRLQRLVANDVARRRRSSSVARQSEYAFLHALVRDVAYGQILRRDRIAKHRAAGEWIERLAGDRLTSHAELIAHHFVQALEIAHAIGDEDEVRDLTPRTRTFLTLAGDSARTLETSQAEGFYRRALEMTDEADPAYGPVLGRLAEVADFLGRLAEAEQLGKRAILELQAHGDVLGAGEAMVNLAATLWRLGRPEAERRRVAVDAIGALEVLPPGPVLVRAYARMASHELHAGRAGECGTWARKALAVAEGLGVASLKVQPLNLLGIARFESGDEAGIDDIREAVRIGLEAGLSSETATAHSNLAATMWVSEGPGPALMQKRAAAEFAASRGLLSHERTIRAEALWQQFDGGNWDDALASIDALLGSDGAAGPNRVTTMAQTVKTRILAERGRTTEAGELASGVLARARDLGDPQDLGPALAAAAALQQALGDHDAAAGLIDELERVTRGRDESQRVHELPQAARICRASGTISVAEALIPARGAPTYQRACICLLAGQAEVAEAHGRFAVAVDLHAEAAASWQAFGSPLEAGHSLLGRARCLMALGRSSEAAGILREAQTIGRQLGARQLAAESDALFAQARSPQG